MTDPIGQESHTFVFSREGDNTFVRWQPLYVAVQAAESVSEPPPVALDELEGDDWTIRQTLPHPEPCLLADYIAGNSEGIVRDSAVYEAIGGGDAAEDTRRLSTYLQAARGWLWAACRDGADVRVIPVSTDMTDIIDY